MTSHRITRETGQRIANQNRRNRYQPPTRYKNTRPIPGASTKTGIAKTGGSGIGGRTGAGTSGDPWIWGSATCTDVNVSTGVLSATTYTVYNSVEASIGADEVIQWKMIDGKRFVDVEGC